MGNSDAVYSTMVRAGRTTFFVDVKEAKNGSKYLSITESRLDGDQKRKTTIRIFGDSVQEFRQAISDAAAAVTAS
jgi:hypothetical protein